MNEESTTYLPLSELLVGLDRQSTEILIDLKVEEYPPPPSGYFDLIDGLFKVDDLDYYVIIQLGNLDYYLQMFEQLHKELNDWKKTYGDRLNEVHWLDHYSRRIMTIRSNLLSIKFREDMEI